VCRIPEVEAGTGHSLPIKKKKERERELNEEDDEEDI